MKKFILISALFALSSLSVKAQYNTTYSDPYGRTIGTATTQSNYGGGTTTTYTDPYGRTIGTRQIR